MMINFEKQLNKIVRIPENSENSSVLRHNCIGKHSKNRRRKYSKTLQKYMYKMKNKTLQTWLNNWTVQYDSNWLVGNLVVKLGTKYLMSLKGKKEVWLEQNQRSPSRLIYVEIAHFGYDFGNNLFSDR